MSANKWCPLRIYGSPVDSTLAKEVIFRTQYQAIPYTNDHAWTAAIHRNLGYDKVNVQRNSMEELAIDFTIRRLARILPLNYLSNDQIGSVYIGGLHGWMQWDGKVGTLANTYNIGKDPNDMDLMTDLAEIGQAFPMLSLECWVENEPDYDSNYNRIEAPTSYWFHAKLENGKATQLDDMESDRAKKLEESAPGGLSFEEHVINLFGRQEHVGLDTYLDTLVEVSGKSIPEIQEQVKTAVEHYRKTGRLYYDLA